MLQTHSTLRKLHHIYLFMLENPMVKFNYNLLYKLLNTNKVPIKG